MTTEREKIIQLARECGLIGYYLKQDDFIEAFYHKAQAEAFEIDANIAESRVQKQSARINRGKPFYDYMYPLDIAAAIREMAKEVK